MTLVFPENYALVEIEQKFQDENGSVKIDPTWTPEEYVTLQGKVYSAPERVRSDRHRTIIGTVAPGDDIWFSYGVIFDYAQQEEHANPVYKNLISYQGREFWKVEMGEIFCKIVDNQPVMITDNILLDYALHVEDPKVSDFYIGAPKVREDVLRIVAMPQKSNLSCQVGDLVSVEPKYIQHYSILGRNLLVLPSRRILAKVSE